MEISLCQMGTKARLSLLILLTFSISARVFGCPGSSLETMLEPGEWGADGAALRVFENSASIEFNCAFGRIREPISVQPGGHFSVSGDYHPESGGPGLLSDKEPAAKAAVFSGTVIESELHLYIELPEEGRSIGPFTLNKSVKAELEKCL